MNFIDIEDGLMVNLDTVTGIERHNEKTRIYIGLTGESVLSGINYDTLRSIIVARSSKMQQSSPALDSMVRDLRQLAKNQTTPVP